MQKQREKDKIRGRDVEGKEANTRKYRVVRENIYKSSKRERTRE